VPMLLNVPETLCDANYVNNSAIRAPDDGLQFLVYPSGTSSFAIHDGTLLTCRVDGSTMDLTLTSAGRPIELKVFGSRPASVTRDSGVLTEHATSSGFEAATTGWRHELGFTSVKFPHSGGSTLIRL